MRLESAIAIAADPHRVWKVLTDFPAYREWNRCLPAVEGSAAAGSTLRVEIAWPGLERGRYRLHVLTAAPSCELRWRGKLGLRGLMDGDHRFVIESPHDNQTLLTQSEDFSGILVPLLVRRLANNVLQGFVEMNAALKQRAEAMAPEASERNNEE